MCHGQNQLRDFCFAWPFKGQCVRPEPAAQGDPSDIDLQLISTGKTESMRIKPLTTHSVTLAAGSCIVA